MEEHGKRQLAIALVAFAGIAYFFVCAIPLPKTLVLEPAWSAPVPAGAASLASALPGSPDKARLHPYKLQSGFGYYDESGTFVSAAAMPFGVAISDSSFVTYDQVPEFLALRAADGKETAKITEPGYPFYGAGRLFIMHPGQTSVAEVDAAGRRLWSYDFPSIVTAFDASPSMALFGLLDGRLVGLDGEGREVLDFSPGGSRIAGIYGCAISPDGGLAAAVTGLDRQRLVVLEKRSSAYRVTYHRYLPSDFRRPVSMAFTGDGRYLVYEQPASLGVYDRAARSESELPANARSGIGTYSESRGILLAIESDSAGSDLLCASPSGRRLFSLPFEGTDSFLSLSGDAVFLGMAGVDGRQDIVRLDFKEE